jgi:hypothetical protein
MPATKSLVSRLASTIEALEARLNPRPRVVDTVELLFVGSNARADLHHFSPARDSPDRIVLSFGDDEGGTPQQRWTRLGERMAPHIRAGSISEEQVLAEAGGEPAIEAWIREGLEKGRAAHVVTWLSGQR